MNELQKDAQAFKESQLTYLGAKPGQPEYNQAVCKMDELITKCEDAGNLNQFLDILNGGGNG